MSIRSGVLPNPSRRAFLGGRRPPAPALRPPWSVLPEARFIDLCTGCSACIDACPERIIGKGEGDYPVVDFGVGECTFCGACAAACRPGALDPSQSVPWPWHAQAGHGCLCESGVVCESCRDVCPERAIRFSPGTIARPAIDADRCTGCGACLRVCPTAAITLRDGAGNAS